MTFFIPLTISAEKIDILLIFIDENNSNSGSRKRFIFPPNKNIPLRR